ncbi:MAG: hypothetical protein JWL81_1610 [Verrucomicrobiales bacterium]|nr:hypothetical protein [Verrucomicrobiales bacterium]
MSDPTPLPPDPAAVLPPPETHAPAAAPATSAPPAATSAAASAKPKVKPENPLHNLLLNVLIPVVILTNLNKDAPLPQLGPQGALIVALIFPIAYQIYDYRLRRKWNLFSLIGFISVLLTGGLGLLNLSAQVFAWKEAAVPLILGALIYFSHKGDKPLVKSLLLNPDMFDMTRIESAIEKSNSRRGYERLLWTSTLLLTASMLLSAVLNYILAMYFLHDKIPGTPEYTAAIGAQTGWGYLVVGVPSLLMMAYALFRLFKGLKTLTGLETDDLMLPR